MRNQSSLPAARMPAGFMPTAICASGGNAGRIPATREFVRRHVDGSIVAKGQTEDGLPTGYWEWFRTDGSRSRSGYFDNGVQVGEWTTYDRNGEILEVNRMLRQAR